MKKRVLWVGDGPDVGSGFGRATREILEVVNASDRYEITVLGINHRGDPGTVPYPVYTAAAGGDAFGVGRMLFMCDLVRPDVIIIQQDGWYFPYYFNALRKKKENYEYESPDAAAVPVIGAVAIDGQNFNGEWLKDLTHTVFWTQFGQSEARQGGFTGESTVIPLGVDLSTFFPVNREGALERQQLGVLKDKFIVGNVNRNQYRKRWDLTLRYFALWVHKYGIKDAFLFLHSAPTGDRALNIADLAKFYRINKMVALYEPQPFYGKPDEDMRDVYNCFDVAISTSQGEGMGLTAMEAMACGVPCILPQFAALGDWAAGAAAMIPCTSYSLQSFHPDINVIGGVADETQFVAALDRFYRERDTAKKIGEYGLKRVSESRFRWENIGQQWLTVLDNLFIIPEVPEGSDEIWQEVGQR